MRSSARHLATISLVTATVVFAATLPVRHTFWGGLLHAFAEAAMIGGLADWFAVVALFRHPLGIPIPHTAILPAHRARLTQGIIDIVQNTWLHKDAIRARIDRWDVGATLATWLASSRARAALASAVRTVAREILRGIDAPRLSLALRDTLHARITPDDLARWLRGATERAIADRLHDPLVDALLSQAGSHLKTPTLERTVTKMLREAADAYATSPMKKLGRWLAENAGALEYTDLARALLGAAAADLESMRRDLAHPLRREIDTRLQDVMAANTSLAESLHHALFTSPATIDALSSAIERAAEWIREDVERSEGILVTQIDTLLEQARTRLTGDATARAAVDTWIKERIVHIVDEHHGEIGALVRENLERLDDAQLVAQIESKVGADLQYIRINGAVVGGLVGALLYLLTHSLP